MIGSAIGGVIGAITGAVQANKEQEIADKNFDLQKEQFDYQKQLNDRQFNYQKELNNLQMQREDNAVQRRAKDLEAAGLSKTLAAGSSAVAGSMSSGGSQSSGSAPQQQVVRNAGLQALDIGMGIANQYQSISNMVSDNALKQSSLQTDAVKRENIAQDTINKQADVLKTKADTELSKTNAELNKEHITDRQLKRDKEIQELISKTDLLKAQDVYTQQQTINAQHNKAIGDLYSLPVGAAPNQSKYGSFANDLVRLNNASGQIIRNFTTTSSRVLDGLQEGIKDNAKSISKDVKSVGNTLKKGYKKVRSWIK